MCHLKPHSLFCHWLLTRLQFPLSSLCSKVAVSFTDDSENENKYELKLKNTIQLRMRNNWGPDTLRADTRSRCHRKSAPDTGSSHWGCHVFPVPSSQPAIINLICKSRPPHLYKINFLLYLIIQSNLSAKTILRPQISASNFWLSFIRVLLL